MHSEWETLPSGAYKYRRNNSAIGPTHSDDAIVWQNFGSSLHTLSGILDLNHLSVGMNGPSEDLSMQMVKGIEDK